MTILLHKLIILSPNKHPAEIDFNGQSHLIYGPTDTGKSYIVECLRYGLGGSKKPKNLEYSEGYNLLILQVSNANRENYTIYRSLLEANSAIFAGHHITMPSLLEKPISEDIEEFILNWTGSNQKKILTKTGTLGKFSATDLRHLSIFDEIETLDNVPLEGKDSNLKTRRKSALALALTGSDDTDLVLPPSTTDRHIAKGHAEALADEISSLKGEIPEDLNKNKATAELLRISSEIEKINNYIANNSARIEELKTERAREEKEYRTQSHRLSSLKEALNRFILLDNKYESDFQRLQTINTVANIVNNFPAKPCPLCMADIKHQVKHSLEQEDTDLLAKASQAEAIKIISLRNGLGLAIKDVHDEIFEVSNKILTIQSSIQSNASELTKILSPEGINVKKGLGFLVEQKASLTVYERYLARIEKLQEKLESMRKKSKRQQNKIDRNLSQSTTDLCKQIENLLNMWGVPGVLSVHFDDKVADIQINHRPRVSFGKGKRGIFLAAYVISLMEKATLHNYPHLGIAIIDSPIVTYKDPKYSNDNPEDLLPISVKNNFYNWLSSRNGQGQIIIFENEEPSEDLKNKLCMTEFVGSYARSGRSGFFPA